MNKNFVESFVKECYKQGLTEKQACAALEATMQKSAAGTRTEYGDAYGDLAHLGDRLAGIEVTRGQPTYDERPQWTNLSDIPGLLWGGFERNVVGPAANWLIPGIYRDDARVHDPYASRNYTSTYAKNFRRDWDRARAVAAERLALARERYGADDPRYKDFDVARATMEYMYDPIRNRRMHRIEKYEKARKSLERSLALAIKAGSAWDAASLRGQLTELDKQHALNMADSDREDAEFRAMVGGTSGANGQPSSTEHDYTLLGVTKGLLRAMAGGKSGANGKPTSTKHDVAHTLDNQLEGNQRDLARINGDLAYANSGFFNRWVNPLNWGRSIATMDTTQLNRDRQFLINQTSDLRRRRNEIADMQEEVRRRGWTPELADTVMKGGPSMGQQLEDKAKAMAAERERKQAELAKAKAGMRDFGKAMVSFAEPKSPIDAKSMAAVAALTRDPAAKPAKPAAPVKPAPVKKPVVAPKPAETASVKKPVVVQPKEKEQVPVV